MILSKREINDGLNYRGHWLTPSKEMLIESHLEANARIKELEAKLRELKEIVDAYYDDCLGPVDAMKEVTRIVTRR